ncbi:hypothetical protein IVB27_38565 [Bradyrhizobium sp. 197]|uniref:hypothetical protein n=1 Tax=Bradyrhizobium sp. 197 TaxID=2782663 RepID=UPI001FF8569E|nr:hypothetical protein [Bradyrhizobium sp. 197]MCK1480483.1 hypothetical protein [Bradyrhizobium sp. 197]
MAVDVREVQQRSAEAFSAAYSEESANYQRAALVGDTEECARSANAMAGLRATCRELDMMAQEALNPARPAPPVNRFGLTELEADVARNSYSAPGVTDDQKMQAYAHNRAKYRHMVQTGQYSNDQGLVRR